MGKWASHILLLSMFFLLVSMPVHAEETKRIVVKYKTEHALKGLSYTSKSEDKSRKTKILTVSKAEAQKLIKSLKKDPTVIYAEEEKEYHYYGSPVNDAYFPNYQLKDYSIVKAAEAWKSFIPKSRPVVAVLDSGIDMSHPDLKNMI